MRYLSRIFQPLITIPKNAVIKNTDITCKSQKLLLECGLIRPTSSGLFTILPLARRSIGKLESLIKQHIDAAGGQQMSLPSLVSEGLWKKSGRLEGSPAELMQVQDRHEKDYLLAPTHEESIADLMADVGPLSYKQLPIILYQITNKYRDEHRPKHGLLRAREFSMLDAYGVHPDGECTHRIYGALQQAYKKLFEDMQLPVYKVVAPTGDMGGTLSHEYQLPAAAGEDNISICASCSNATLTSETGACSCGGQTETANSIEVGHTFILGTKYSEPLSAKYIPASGSPRPVTMSCYGIGITRLLAASLEHLSTEKALRWPQVIAPFDTIIIGPKEGSKEGSSIGPEMINKVYGAVHRQGRDVLIDDRNSMTIGKRLMMADRMGYPNIIVMGKAALDSPPKFEVYRAGDPNPRLQTLEELALTASPQEIRNKVEN